MILRAASLFLALCLLAAAPASAADGPQVGLIGGVGLSGYAFSTAPPMDISKRPRPVIGGVLEVPLTDHAAIQGRVLWQRVAILGTNTGANVDVTASVDYITVPLLLKASAATGGVRPYVFGGPEFSIRSRAVLTITPTGGKPTTVASFEGALRKGNVAVDIGAGVEIPVGRVSLLAEGMYSHGLLNIVTPEGGAEESGWADTVKTRGFLMMLGVRF